MSRSPLWEDNRCMALCACGCGRETAIITHTIKALGYIAGQSYTYVRGHRSAAAKHYRRAPGTGSLKTIHRQRAELALGRPLPKGAVVHHADGSKSPLAPLIICQDDAYHNLLHARMVIVRAGGDPQTHRLCSRCERLLEKAAFTTRKSSWDGRHTECRDCTNARQNSDYARR